jgi:hypothetical protein
MVVSCSLTPELSEPRSGVRLKEWSGPIVLPANLSEFIAIQTKGRLARKSTGRGEFDLHSIALTG